MVRDLYADPAVAAVLRRHGVVMPEVDRWRPAGPFESYAPLPLGESLLRALYVEQGLSLLHVSLVCGVGMLSVLNGLKRYGLPLRDNRQCCPWYERTYFQTG
jgi:hypothetical protein